MKLIALCISMLSLTSSQKIKHEHVQQKQLNVRVSTNAKTLIKPDGTKISFTQDTPIKICATSTKATLTDNK